MMLGRYDPILFWSRVALEAHRRDFTYSDACGIDETGKGRSTLRPHVGGPTRVSRAFAIVHLAMYDTLLMADPLRFHTSHSKFKDLKTYQPLLPSPQPFVSREAAVAGAAAATIRSLFDDFLIVEDELTKYRLHLHQIGQSTIAIENGVSFGDTIGRMILDSRAEDGSETSDTGYRPLNLPGTFVSDPFASQASALGATWGVDVEQFGIYPASAISFTGPTEALGGAKLLPEMELPGAFLNAPGWPADRDLVTGKGAVGGTQGLTRTAEETVIGIFWSYEGVRGVGDPPRLYNQCLHVIAQDAGLATEAIAVLMACANVAMADAGVHAWREKYTYQVGRPVSLLRAAENGFRPGTSSAPTFSQGQLDMPVGGASTPSYRSVEAWLSAISDAPTLVDTDAHWAPLGTRLTNIGRQDGGRPKSQTPACPAYPSGHATFGSACFGTASALLSVLGQGADIEFAFVSDEYDGQAIDAGGSVRPRHIRRMTLAQAIHENAWSGIYLGVHWRMDAVEGVRLGRQLVDALKDHPIGPFHALAEHWAPAANTRREEERA